MSGSGEPDLVHKIGQTPVWHLQGGRFTLVLPEWSVGTADVLDDAGDNVRVTVHEDLAHECWTRVYAEDYLYLWLVSHSRRPSPDAPEST